MDTTTANALKQIAAALHCTAAAIDTIASASCAAEQKAPSFLPDAEEQSLREEAAKKTTAPCPPQIAVAAKVALAKAEKAKTSEPVKDAVPEAPAPKAKAAKAVNGVAKKVETVAVEVEQPEVATQAMTLVQFRDAISPIAAAKGFDKVKAVFAKHGASVISQVKPEEYAAILEELTNA